MSKPKLYSFERVNPNTGDTLVFYFLGEYGRGEVRARGASTLSERYPSHIADRADIVLNASADVFIKCRVSLEDLLNGAYDVEGIE